jgi:prephenate dehydratase
VTPGETSTGGPRVGYLGPEGTFTEQALLTQGDLCTGELVPMTSIPEVLAAAEAGEVDLGFVPVENAIEGSVNLTLDTLAFDTDLLIQREVVLAVQLNLMGVPGASLDRIERVLSMPMATGQCRGFLAKEVPNAVSVAANSTAEAARLVGESGDRSLAAIGPSVAGEIYGLELLAADIADHPENATRFVVVTTDRIPPRSGHDKTTIVCFQSADRPGSLLAILQEFAARAINLTKLESRPTKRGLGDY